MNATKASPRRAPALTTATIRPLDADGVEPALTLMRGEGWGFDAADVERLRHVSHDGFLAAFDEGGRVLGVTLAVPQGPVGWIGNVLVHDDARGRGLGGTLVRRGLDHLAKHGCQTFKLYATPKATPLYTRLGFQGESEVLMMKGVARPRPVRQPLLLLENTTRSAWRALDAKATGADRARLLDRLAGDFPGLALAATTPTGDVQAFGLARMTGDAGEIGPVIAAPGAARALDSVIDGLLDRLARAGVHDVEVAAPRTGPGADAFRCRGFEVVGVGLEMRHGPTEGRDLTMIAAAAGQEKG